jgi:phytol kinase
MAESRPGVVESLVMISGILNSDPALVAVSFGWVVFVIAVGEGTRRLAHLPPDVTRKVIHIGVAAWALPTALLFSSTWWAALMPALFVGLNAISYRLRLMEVIEEEGRGSPGTIYFPLSFAVLILVLWPRDAAQAVPAGRAAMVAGIYAMGFGDAAASVLGRRYGRRRYRVGGVTKSWEGTAVMFGVSFVAILLGTWPLLGQLAWGAALGAAAVAAAAEAPAGHGLDNLSVPLLGAAAFYLIRGIAG